MRGRISWNASLNCHKIRALAGSERVERNLHFGLADEGRRFVVPTVVLVFQNMDCSANDQAVAQRGRERTYQTCPARQPRFPSSLW